MSEIPDYKNRPAFPSCVDHSNLSHTYYTGLTRFEFFAAHAPVDIPEWFGHSMEKNPGPPKMPSLSVWMRTHEHASLFIHEWDFETDDWYDQGRNGPIYDQLNAEVIEYLKELGENTILEKEWQAENQVQRFFQWRAYYANKMCEL